MKIQIVILILAFAFSGCNYKLREIPKSNANSETSQANTEIPASDGKTADTSGTETADDGLEGGELLISDTGINATYDCKNREVELDKDTTANSVTLTGTCKKVTVDGVSNKVFVEQVGQIIVRGVSNKVVYESGIGGGEPKISVSGTSTSAKKKEMETKPESNESEMRKPKE